MTAEPPKVMHDEFRLGDWLVHPSLTRISKPGTDLHVRAKVMDVLVYLARHSGEVVSKDALLQDVWGIESISESTLTRTIAELRQALGDDVEQPLILETIPKRGYRLIAPVVSAQREGVTDTDNRTHSVPLNPEFSTDLDRVTAQALEKEARIGTKRGRVWLLASAAVGILLLFFTWQWERSSLRAPSNQTIGRQITTVVVLPLKNLTGDPGQDYFVDGMTEALSTTLSQISVFRVISNTSAMHYRNTTKLAPEIARELGGVDALVEGGVFKSGNHLRVTVALVHATTDQRLWTDTSEHDVADVFALYNDIARVTAREISVAVSQSDQARLAKSRAVRPEAYDAYFRGTQFLRRRMSGGCVEAERFFLQAIELDRAFALPYADLAVCFVFPDNLQRPVADVGPKASEYANKAIALDPFLARAYVVLGLVAHRIDFNWDAAEPLLKRGIDLDHSDPLAHMVYGEYLYAQGRRDEGTQLAEKATRLDPLSPDRNVGFGYALMNVRRYDAAIEQFKKTLKLDPSHSTAQFWLAETYARKGSYDAAVTEHLKWLEDVLLPERAAAVKQALLRAYTNGREAFWRREIEFAEEEAKTPGTVLKHPYGRYCGPFYMAQRYARVGDLERALQSLEAAYQARHHQMVFIKIDPDFDVLHEDPRFADLLRRVGLNR